MAYTTDSYFYILLVSVPCILTVHAPEVALCHKGVEAVAGAEPQLLGEEHVVAQERGVHRRHLTVG